MGPFRGEEDEEDEEALGTKAPEEAAPSKRGRKPKKKEGPRRRARHVELHEHTAVEEILAKLNRKGLIVEHYAAQDEPLFEIQMAITATATCAGCSPSRKSSRRSWMSAARACRFSVSRAWAK
ncbi:MAG: hypothetical protein CM1200mP29_13250 [Verrucomicrobiota bacterium]|nr:MAG: hypothetical protein CM1200mP29_13250 [Verrucomicrobiota bacterium]